MDDHFGLIPDPDNPGWLLKSSTPTGRFLDLFGEIRVRVEAGGKARLRVVPEVRHRNVHDQLHGGFTLALIDQALFIGPAAMGIEGSVGGVTIETGAQFFATLEADRPVDVVVELLRETRKMVFLRGIVEQDGTSAVAFTGTFKKAR